MKKYYFKFVYIIGAILIIIFNFIPAFADEQPITGPVEQVGPIEQVGPVQSVGPQIQPGTTRQTGPQGPTGRQDPAIAVEAVGAVNSQTGANSLNENSVSNSEVTNVDENSSSDINNTADVDLNTGKNTVDSNTGVGNVITGNAEGSINLINLTNSTFGPNSSVGTSSINGAGINQLIIPETASTSRLFFPSNTANTLTGSSSINTNNIDNQNVVSFIDDQTNSILNNLAIVVDTGDNQILKNTKVGTIATGDIAMGVNLLNLENFNSPNTTLDLNIWSVNNGLSGDLIIPDLTNNITGSLSANANLVTSNELTNVSNISSNDVSNTFDYRTNTGENIIDSNSAIGDVITGETQTSGSVVNIVAEPVFYIINVFGRWLGKSIGIDGGNYIVNDNNGSHIFDGATIISPTITQGINQGNIATGVGSENLNSLNSDSLTNINSNTDNKISNKILIDANTGRNTISKNSLLGNVKTGSINIISNVENIIGGLYQKFGRVKIGIINIYGDWNGDLSNLPINHPPKLIPAATTAINSIPANNPVLTSLNRLSRGSAIISPSELYPKLPDLNSAHIAESNGIPTVLGDMDQKNNNTPFPYRGLAFPAIILALWLGIELVLRKLTK